jgi:hypothetical protein
MTRLTATLLISAALLSGCGDSANPFGWFRPNSDGPGTLEPEGGYGQISDQRPGIPQITSARWEQTNEGRLLVVTGLTPTKGYSDAALVTASPQPSGRISPDLDGVLRLRFVALPPLPDSDAARMPANPVTDSITTAMSLSHLQLSRIVRVEIAGASNVVSITR